MNNDVLDDIQLTMTAVAQWQTIALRVVEQMRRSNSPPTQPDDILDEQAFVQPDGSLKLVCQTKTGECIASMVVKPQDWDWAILPH
jgi:hypothetical protein